LGRFPTRLAASGLLLLRIVLSQRLVTSGVPRLVTALDTADTAQAAFGLLFLLCAAFTATGFLTPLVQTIVVIVELAVLWSEPPIAGVAGLIARPWPAPLLEASIAASLALIGPGAFSVDARLFGLHEIVIPPRNRRVPNKFC
jgi:putative oxidoreductase